MIKENELRIGNIVNVIKAPKEYQDELGQLTCVGYSIHLISTNKDIVVEGIPLTEDWLLRFGFEKDFQGDYMLSFNGREYYYSMKTGFLSKDFGAKIRLNQFPIYQVHQLQNLYFALTQTELTPTP